MFRLKQYLKMVLQNGILPAVYFCFCHAPVRKGSVIFADAHHAQMPFSMRRMYEAAKELERKGQCRTQLFICDFAKLSFFSMILYLLRFMKQYATAEYVFICDYYLPVSSCRKRRETTVVQLWHSCGLMKKIAYDAGQDIPSGYKGDMFGNYSWLTLSAKVCVPVHARALRMDPARIRATGVSRTDYYFDQAWNESCRARFYEQYPQAAGKKIVLWAPTFRGNAAMPQLEGLPEIRKMAQELGEEWYLIIKAHPHIDAHQNVSNCTILTEELLAVTDVLVTDYSSVLFDYLIYEKAAVLFAPDLQKYEEGRGFYLDYRKIPFPHAGTYQELAEAVRTSEDWYAGHREEISGFRRKYVGACDGAATQRILNLAGLAAAHTDETDRRSL